MRYYLKKSKYFRREKEDEDEKRKRKKKKSKICSAPFLNTFKGTLQNKI